MALMEVNWNPSRRELRQFGALCAGFFGLLGAYLLWVIGSRPAAAACWAMSAYGMLGLVFPSALRLLYVLWMALAFPIGWVVSHVLLLAVYYLVLTPIGLAMRLVGYDPLQRRFERGAASYWTSHDPSAEPARYFKQF